MQHTLLPAVERKVLRREYRTRVFIVFCFGVSLALMIGAGALFPTFLLALNEERLQLDTIAILKKGKADSGITAIEQELARNSVLIGSLSKERDTPEFSTFTESVISVRGNSRITSLAYESLTEESVSLVIQGISPTRDDLLSLKMRLEELVPGARVELPISSLAQSRDLPFSLRITQTMP